MFEEFTSLTEAEALTYCAGSESQRVRAVISERVGKRHVIDIGCGKGIDAQRYPMWAYFGVDVSEALVATARKLHPGYEFAAFDMASDLVGAASGNAFDDRVVCQKALMATLRLSECAIIKSVLEHVPTVEVACTIIRNAMRVRENLYIAWHTPPRPVQTLRRVPGHFGKIVHQNTWARSAFDWIGEITIEQIDNFELWTINTRAQR